MEEEPEKEKPDEEPVMKQPRSSKVNEYVV